ncbi:hypothetical protein LXL04_006882 [Taraxacum kok-saghyz]
MTLIYDADAEADEEMLMLMNIDLKLSELVLEQRNDSDAAINRITEAHFSLPRRTSLSWVARLKIAIGAGEGLLYLHKRNSPAFSQFKTKFILVDTDFNARLSDFNFDPHMFQLEAYYAAPE